MDKPDNIVQLTRRAAHLERQLATARRALADCKKSSGERDHAHDQEFLIGIALRLLQPIERDELFTFVTERIYSLTAGGIVLFSEFEPTSRRTILRAMGSTPDERTRVRDILGHDPFGLAFDFPERVRAMVLPGELVRLSGGICELAFYQLPQEMCAAFERTLAVRAVYAMACSVEQDLLGTVAVLAKGEPLPHKRLIETTVSEAALALKRRRVEESLRNERNFFDTVVDTQGTILAILDRHHRVVRLNRAYYAITGFAPGSMVGHDFADLMAPESRPAMQRQPTLPARQWPTGEFESLLHVSTGESRIVSWRSTVNRTDNGDVDYIIATGIDITDRKRMEERTRYLAEHDPLTDLPNRRLLLALLEASLRSARRRQHKVAVLFLDLDRFKFVNDNLGHEAGDALLKQVSHRLSSRVRRSDVVARLGGDEFALLLGELSRAEQAGDVAKEVLTLFHAPFSLPGQALHSSASIGISLFPDDSDTAEGLLRRADLAMYEAKEQGRNTFRFYNPIVDRRAHDRASIENSLRLALGRDELRLVYQPEIELRSGRLAGVEALVRWHHPDLGVLDPERFIPVAEDTGLIASLDEWVLTRACAQASRWMKAGAAPFHIAVNLSARSFEGADLPSTVRRHLAESGLPPQYLELELTEYTVMHHAEQGIKRMHELVALGVSISVDDFGTGYSSLSYLKQLPIRKLKIDQSFVRDIPTDADDRAIIQAVTSLAHTLNKLVIAEGVENEAQRAFLAATGCDEGQGYLFHRPLAPEQISTLLPH